MTRGSTRTLIMTGLLTLGFALPAVNTAGQQIKDSPDKHLKVCKDFIQDLMDWEQSSPANEDRFIWFVATSSQVSPVQYSMFARGRLDYKATIDQLKSEGKLYYLVQPYGVSNKFHAVGGPYEEPTEGPPQFSQDAEWGDFVVRLATASPMLRFGGTFGTVVSDIRCADGVIYGWEDVPEGEDPLTYPKTFYVVSLNKMSGLKQVVPKIAVAKKTYRLPSDILQAHKQIVALEQIVAKLALENESLKKPPARGQ